MTAKGNTLPRSYRCSYQQGKGYLEDVEPRLQGCKPLLSRRICGAWKGTQGNKYIYVEHKSETDSNAEL
jgi:hypothetical protein